jgi:hypothetical protein
MTTSLSVRWTAMTVFHVSAARRFAKDFSINHILISSVHFNPDSCLQFRRTNDVVWCGHFLYSFCQWHVQPRASGRRFLSSKIGLLHDTTGRFTHDEKCIGHTWLVE